MRAKMSEGRRVSGGAAFQPHAHKGSHVWEETGEEGEEHPSPRPCRYQPCARLLDLRW